MCVGVMGAALVSPLYPLYQVQWSLKTSDITGIYVAYMYGTLGCLLFLGRLSDRFGFLPVLRAGLILMTAASALSALAWGRGPFMFSRVLVGVAAGLIMTSASLGLTQLSRSNNLQRASAMTSFAMAIGFGLGPLVGGIIGQWLPWPLVSAYVPNVALGLLAIYALFQLRMAPPAGAASPMNWRDWMPRITLPPRAVRRPFFVACMGTFTGFGVFGLYAALAPSFIRHMLPWNGPLISGLSIATILFLSATVQWFSRSLSPKTCAMGGLAMLAACNLLLIGTTYTNWPALFVLSVLCTAVGHGLMNLASVAIVNKVTVPANRSAVFSSYLVVGYLGAIVPIAALGWMSDWLGLSLAIEIFCAVICLMSLALMELARRTALIAPGDMPAR